ncbi:hypothetical protein K3495_g8202 [Podosphaera aphanis]|nr:hypothetical protein K3495_g8202 [Podosphaera aphanis]
MPFPRYNFGAETWWLGKSRTELGKVVSNMVGSHLSMIEKVHRAAAGAILLVYCTTPSAVLFREAGLNPAELVLNNISRRAAIRTRRLNPHHSLRLRAQKSLSAPALSRFARSHRGIPASEQINPIVDPPWEVIESKQDSLIRVCDPSGPRHTRGDKFLNFLQTLPKSDVLVFSDSSQLPDAKTGSGFIIYQFGIKVCSEAFPLGHQKDCFDAEAFADLQGIRAAISLPSARFSNDI